MASTLTTSTNYAKGTGNIREDLSDVVSNISPVDTPFLNGIGKGKAQNTNPEWLIDTLADAATNTANEGAEAAYSAESGATRVANLCVISTKTLEISNTLKAVNLAGRKDEVKYQLNKKFKELARDMELNLLNNVYAAGPPRVMRGMLDWMDDATYVTLASNFYDFAGAYANTNLLTETIFNNGMEGAWSEGGEVDNVLCSPKVKRTISGFNGSDRLTVNAESTKKELVNVVDVYEGDFGLVKIRAERHFATDLQTGNYYGHCFLFEKKRWEVAYLRPVKATPMAQTADSDRTLITTEYTLKSRAPKANHLISKIFLNAA